MADSYIRTLPTAAELLGILAGADPKTQATARAAKAALAERRAA